MSYFIVTNNIELPKKTIIIYLDKNYILATFNLKIMSLL